MPPFSPIDWHSPKFVHLTTERDYRMDWRAAADRPEAQTDLPCGGRCDRVGRPDGDALPSGDDDDLTSSMSLREVAQGVPNLAQRERPIHDRCELPGLDEPLQGGHCIALARQ